MSQSGRSSRQPQGNPRKRMRAVEDDDGRSSTLSAAGASEPQENSLGEIQVGTGDEQKAWRVHIKRFAAMSPWLKEAFVRAAVEQPGTECPVVKIPDESPRIFGWVHDWVYAVSFSGLKSAPVPIINDAGSHGLELQKQPEKPAAPEEDDDDVVITSVRVKVENEAKPLANPAPAEAAPATDSKPVVGTDSDELQEVAADKITPRDLIDLYLLGLKLGVFSLRNAAIDALYVWFHPDVQEKEKTGRRRNNRGRTANPAAVVDVDADEMAEAANDDYEPAKRLPFRRVPWLTDVRHAFSHTPDDNPLRRFLVSTLAVCLFSKRPEGRTLPEEWKAVLTGAGGGEIGFCLLQFVAQAGWVAGAKKTGQDAKLQVLRIWQRYAFHEAETNISL